MYVHQSTMSNYQLLDVRNLKFSFIFFINMNIHINLHVPQLILQVLKLTII